MVCVEPTFDWFKCIAKTIDGTGSWCSIAMAKFCPEDKCVGQSIALLLS